MEDQHHHLPLQKLTISGPTLSSLLNRFTSSHGDVEGVLFGHISHLPPSLSDNDSSSSSSTAVASVTSFLSSATTSFSDFSSLLLRHLHHRRLHLLGWFSARRHSPLRPSLREFTVSHAISSDPHLSLSHCLFLLLTTPPPFHNPQTLIHTVEFKAFQYLPRSSEFESLSLDVVNIGPAFRGQYGAFCPSSMIPMVACDLRVGSPMREDKDIKEKESLGEMKRVSKDQKELEAYAEGYEIGSLSRLMGSDAVSYMAGVEELYDKMLARLGSLTKLVESSSARVLEQESYNMKLRHKVAGLE